MYKHLVKCLVYLSTTRLDLAYAVSAWSQFMSKPLERNLIATKGILRYLPGTLDYEILYTDSCDVKLTGFSDSNWAGNVDKKRSITGYMHLALGPR